MSKIIQALKALYVKLGGQASTVADVTQTPDMINAIAGLDIGGGGSSLPDVTADDNGKVLAVVEGAWDKAEASGGSNDFVVNLTKNGNNYTADKTINEIWEALPEKNVILINVYGTHNAYINRLYITTLDASRATYLCAIGIVGTTITVYKTTNESQSENAIFAPVS